MKKLPRSLAAIAIGAARPSLPVQVLAEDFSLLVRKPRRLRGGLGRRQLVVLH